VGMSFAAKILKEAVSPLLFSFGDSCICHGTASAGPFVVTSGGILLTGETAKEHPFTLLGLTW
jgi:hypothetical protein